MTDPWALPCPYCQRVNELHLAPADPLEVPEAGAASMCWYCGNPSIYDSSPLYPGRLVLRWPTETEARELDEQEDFQQMKAAWRERGGMDPLDFSEAVRRKGTE